jgi:hypothetical protein
MTDPGIPPMAVRDDASCVVAWRVDDHEAIEVYVDPALADREPQICQTVEVLCATNRDVDTLSDAIETYADGESLSASIYDRPDGESPGVIAVAFTLG